MLRGNDPELYEMIFGEDQVSAGGSGQMELSVVRNSEELEERLAKLEALLGNR